MAINLKSNVDGVSGSLQVNGTDVLTVNSSGTYSSLNGLVGNIPTIASSATIAPTTKFVFVSGTTTVSTITNPFGTNSGQITIIPTGIFTTNTAGNIALTSTAVVNKSLIMTYDPTTAKWYPSY